MWGVVQPPSWKPPLNPALSRSERASARSAFLSDTDHDTMVQHFATGWPGPREKLAQAQFVGSHTDGGGIRMSVSQVTPVIETPESSTNGYAVIGTRPI